MLKSTAVAVLSDGRGRQSGVLFPPNSCSKYSGLFWIFLALISGVIVVPYFCRLQQQVMTRLRARQTQLQTDEEEPLLEPSNRQELEDQQADQIVKMTNVALRKAMLKETKFFVPAYTMGCLAAVFNASIDYYTGKVLDATIATAYKDLVRSLVMLTVVGFSYALTSSLRGSMFVAATGGLTHTFRVGLFQNLIQQEAGFFDATRIGDLNSRLSSDCMEITDMLTLNLNVLMRSATQVVTVLVFMFGTSWRLTVITFILVPLILFICKVYGNYYKKLVKKCQNALADSGAVAEEALAGITTIRAHAAEASFLQQYSNDIRTYARLVYRQSLAYFLYLLINNGLPVALLVVVLLYGGHLVFVGEGQQAGWLVSFILYEKSLMNAFQNIGDVYSGLVTAYGASEKVVELTNRKTKIDPQGSGRRDDEAFGGRLQLKNVSFYYPSRPEAPVLKEFNMEVKRGEVVALVGPSGGGKSSVIKLLQRFYEPQTGSVLINGNSIADFDQKWLKRQIAIVSQEPVLFNQSIKDNILLGLTQADGCEKQYSLDDVKQAAIQANAHTFIESFPDGYDTICGEKGTQLSGGQKQRIAIARALIRQPAILLLDEATSALDGESEAVVQAALEKVMVGRTVVLVAHRLSTVVNADRIIVVANGEVKEQGKHEDLIKKEGVYKQLVKKQLTQ